jgi:hypothetical protein
MKLVLRATADGIDREREAGAGQRTVLSLVHQIYSHPSPREVVGRAVSPNRWTFNTGNFLRRNDQVLGYCQLCP